MTGNRVDALLLDGPNSTYLIDDQLAGLLRVLLKSQYPFIKNPISLLVTGQERTLLLESISPQLGGILSVPLPPLALGGRRGRVGHLTHARGVVAGARLHAVVMRGILGIDGLVSVDWLNNLTRQFVNVHT